MNSCFITGTDTGIGKTWATLGLMQAWQDQGLRVAGMKPVATGSEMQARGLRNGDAVQIRAQASRPFPYPTVNPYAFAPPVAPVFAAREAGVEIAADRIIACYRRLAAHTDRVAVEGVGGWRMPLSDRLQMSDLVHALGLPVIMVIGLRLGCINHALLTAESISADGLVLAGWIANAVDPGYDKGEATVELLSARLDRPPLGIIPPLEHLDIAAIADCLAAACRAR